MGSIRYSGYGSTFRVEHGARYRIAEQGLLDKSRENPPGQTPLSPPGGPRRDTKLKSEVFRKKADARYRIAQQVLLDKRLVTYAVVAVAYTLNCNPAVYRIGSVGHTLNCDPGTYRF